MSSSTSLSKGQLRGALILVVAGFFTWIACILYTIRLNPEVRLFVHAAMVKKQWAARLWTDYTNKTVIYGRTICSFRIDCHYTLSNHHFALPDHEWGGGLGAGRLTGCALRGTR